MSSPNEIWELCRYVYLLNYHFFSYLSFSGFHFFKRKNRTLIGSIISLFIFQVPFLRNWRKYQFVLSQRVQKMWPFMSYLMMNENSFLYRILSFLIYLALATTLLKDWLGGGGDYRFLWVEVERAALMLFAPKYVEFAILIPWVRGNYTEPSARTGYAVKANDMFPLRRCSLRPSVIVTRWSVCTAYNKPTVLTTRNETTFDYRW